MCVLIAKNSGELASRHDVTTYKPLYTLLLLFFCNDDTNLQTSVYSPPPLFFALGDVIV